MSIAISIIGVAGVLFASVIREVRRSQKICRECGFRVSKSAAAECPRCLSDIPAIRLHTPRWSKFALVALPVCIVLAEGSVILVERAQTEKDRAITLVK